MSGEPTLQPPAPSAAIAALTAAVVMLAGWAGLFVWLEPLLYEPYAEILGWGTGRGSLGIATGAAVLAGLSCGSRGWRGLPMALLAGSVFATTMVANVTAATVVLWALDPSLATGRGGYLAVFLAGLFLSLPVAGGVLYLLRPQWAWEPPWRERFRNDGPRGPMILRVVLSAAVLYLAWLAASETMFRLAAAYPAVKGINFVPQILPVFAVAMFVATASLPDLRSVMRALLAALVLFEAILALAISGTAVLATLQSDNVLVAITVELLLLAPIYLGAHVLAAHKSGDRGGAADIGQKEADPA